MNYQDLLIVIAENTQTVEDSYTITTAVDQHIKSLAAAKPIVMRSLPPDVEKLKRLVRLGGQEMDGLIKPKIGTPVALEALRKELEAYLAAMPS